MGVMWSDDVWDRRSDVVLDMCRCCCWIWRVRLVEDGRERGRRRGGIVDKRRVEEWVCAMCGVHRTGLEVRLETERAWRMSQRCSRISWCPKMDLLVGLGRI